MVVLDYTELLRSHNRYVRAFKVSKGAKIRNGYNQVPHLTQDTKITVRHRKREPRSEPFPSR